MKKNDFAQIKGLDVGELSAKAKTFKKEIADLVLDKNMKKLKDIKAVFKKRKDLAQVLTVLRQKEMLEDLEVKVKGGKPERGPSLIAQDDKKV